MNRSGETSIFIKEVDLIYKSKIEVVFDLIYEELVELLFFFYQILACNYGQVSLVLANFNWENFHYVICDAKVQIYFDGFLDLEGLRAVDSKYIVVRNNEWMEARDILAADVLAVLLFDNLVESMVALSQVNTNIGLVYLVRDT